MYFKAFKKYIPIALLGVILTATVVVMELNQIDYMGRIIDEGVATSNMQVVLDLGWIMVVWALLGVAFGVGGVICASIASNGFAEQLRAFLYKKVQSFSIKNISKFQSSSLITRLTNDVNYVQTTVMMGLRLLIRAPMMLVTSVVYIVLISKEVAFAILPPLVLLAVGLTWIISQGSPRFVVLQRRLDGLNRRVLEALINIRVIKSFVREDFEDERFKESNEAYFSANLWAQRLMIMINPLMMLMMNISTLIVLYLCSFLILKTQVMKVGSILVILNYVRFTLFSLMMISQVLMMITRSRASITRINEVFAAQESIENPTEVVVIEDVQGSLQFDHVSLKYHEDQIRKTLTDIDLTIHPQERFGIIGSTGSGKSSFVNMIGRLIDPSEGSIRFDGVDIRMLDLHTLRSYLGFVPQKNVLFSGTVRDNLKLGDEAASDEVMIQAAKTASIHDFILSMPQGYDSMLTQGGSNLSGGQKQRMCIARALVMNPKILILDDSTSALDADTESRIKEALVVDYPQTTVISIAQKISSVATCDRIMVMDKGMIVGLATHDELLRDNQVYQEIYQSQMSQAVNL